MFPFKDGDPTDITVQITACTANTCSAMKSPAWKWQKDFEILNEIKTSGAMTMIVEATNISVLLATHQSAFEFTTLVIFILVIEPFTIRFQGA